VAERFKASVLKTEVFIIPRVRIPPFPKNILEITNMYKFFLKYIFISKFCFKYNKSILNSVKISYYFLITKKKKNKTNFFFIILVLIFGRLPYILKKNKKSRKVKKGEFLAFEYNFNFFVLGKLINLYLPITDIVETLQFKFNNQEYRMTINYLPIINEIDKLCIANSELLEFIQDYKLILKFKVPKANWYFSESLIRSTYIPLISKDRFYI
jgi:hypothetical protein